MIQCLGLGLLNEGVSILSVIQRFNVLFDGGKVGI
jgi:hypothetical protein